MSYNSANAALRQYLQVVKLQFLIGVLAILVTAVKSLNSYATISAILGFLLALLPTLVYIRIAWSKKVLPPDTVFAKHKKAELYKFFVNLFGFAIVFIFFRQVHALALFTTYVVTLSSYWFSMFLQTRPKG